MFNFDEIGVQLGGDRKGTGELYFFGAADKSWYKIKSEDLELVTILKTICADSSTTVWPCIIFLECKGM